MLLELYKKFQGRNPDIILLVFWKKLSFYKDIIKLTDLYLTSILSHLCGLLRIHARYQKHFIKNNTYLTFTGIEIRLQKFFDPIAADKTCVLFLQKMRICTLQDHINSGW